ncbi:ATP-binding response regulator [Undibacterium pigrum]|uniref:ATP-binding response regulator n=1 Tax=Undibacterium pigrum TaxID=401470 RepID=UPI001FE46C1C|nr:response regulator [Undibacterium pigrum]
MQAKYKPKILVVNDDTASLFALSGLLTTWADENQCSVVTAKSGEDALRHVLQDDFAVILLDVNMPGMDGFETAEAIHNRARSSSIPIIFITAFLADDLNKLRAYQQGAVDYLFTPIIPQVLQAKVSVFVTLAKKNLELKAQAEALSLRTADLQAANDKLQREIKERKIAVEQNEAKDKFLAMLGHELRNPLSAITSAASIIGFPGAKADSVERAKKILSRQSHHLTRIVDDLLDLGRVMSGKIVLDKTAVNLGEVILSCLDSLRASRPVDSYQWTIDPIDTWVDADPTRAEQIITNLLDNAIKYTPAGGSISIKKTLADGKVSLMITDSGIGISKDLLPRIFNVFVQGEHSLDRAKGGLGIGLALVRQLVELHGGDIHAHSEGENLGSTFAIVLPQAAAIQPSPDQPEVRKMATSQKLLLIEDNEDAREMTTQLLKEHGFQVLEAATGAEGIILAKEEKPGIALIDIGLPCMDGYEVARRLRADKDTSSMYLIALTGYGLREDHVLTAEAGFDSHFVKPLKLQQLILAIETFQVA